MKYYRDIHGRGVRGEITDAELAAARAMLEELLDELERTLDPVPWIVGADYSLAEITIAPYMFRLSALGADQFWSHNRRPRVNDSYKRIAPARRSRRRCRGPTRAAAAMKRSG